MIFAELVELGDLFFAGKRILRLGIDGLLVLVGVELICVHGFFFR